jgi:8-oxo-dGTP pyrophosphatase MutT (NUDIX family)
VKFGESISEVAKRELWEEGHLIGTPKLVHIKHSFVYEKESHKLLEDKFFYFFLVQDPEGTAQGSEEGPVERIARKDFSKKITSIYYDFEDIMVIIDSLSTPNRPLSFEEKSYEVEDF